MAHCTNCVLSCLKIICSCVNRLLENINVLILVGTTFLKKRNFPMYLYVSVSCSLSNFTSPVAFQSNAMGASPLPPSRLMVGLRCSGSGIRIAGVHTV